MDHLQKAIEETGAAREQWDRELSVVHANVAIAHALIALVERLDKIISLDAEGKYGSLCVDDGKP